MPDASWWDSQPQPVSRSTDELQARVRLLESTLLRIRDDLDAATTWDMLRAAARRAKEAAEGVLR